MVRQVSIRCRMCARHFGGHEGDRRHQKRRGDRIVCMSTEELRAAGWTQDRDFVWHRPVGPTATTSVLLRPSESPVPSLFDQIREPEPQQLVRASDPDTSKAAAWKLSGKAGTMRWRLLGVFAQGEELTADEAGARCNFTPADGYWKRVSDLLNAGLIEPTGRTRPGRSGRQQRVLRITETGRRVA